MSKSDGSGVCPNKLLETFGVDAVRYFLIRDGGLLYDPEYSHDMVMNRYKYELAGQVGNLLGRCSSKAFMPTGRMSFPSLDGQTISKGIFTVDDNVLPEELRSLYVSLDTLQSSVKSHLDNCNLSRALECIMDHILDLNQYWGNSSPWKMPQAERDMVTQLTIESLRICGILLTPIIPEKASTLIDSIGVPLARRTWSDARVGAAAGLEAVVTKTILFPAVKV
jgi:methionyl-tRNA synthetase